MCRFQGGSLAQHPDPSPCHPWIEVAMERHEELGSPTRGLFSCEKACSASSMSAEEPPGLVCGACASSRLRMKAWCQWRWRNSGEPPGPCKSLVDPSCIHIPVSRVRCRRLNALPRVWTCFARDGRVRTSAHADPASARGECMTISPVCSMALERLV